MVDTIKKGVPGMVATHCGCSYSPLFVPDFPHPFNGEVDFFDHLVVQVKKIENIHGGLALTMVLESF